MFPDDPFVRNQLATVLADDLNDRVQAQEVLNAAISEGVADEATHSLLSKVEQQRPLRRRQRTTERQPDESSLRLPTAEARRILFRFEAGLVDRNAVRTFLAKASPDSYLTYVAERAGVSNLPLKTTRSLSTKQSGTPRLPDSAV